MRARYIYLIALLTAALDQSAKLLIARSFPCGSSAPILGGLGCITPVQNPGGAFGLFPTSTGLLTLVTMAVVVAILVLTRRRGTLPILVGAALAFQLGGALGNLADRIRLGYVFDFLNFRVWPVFNIADCAITVGILFLIYHLLTCERGQSVAGSQLPAVSSEVEREGEIEKQASSSE